jgi:hypothetical protein
MLGKLLCAAIVRAVCRAFCRDGGKRRILRARCTTFVGRKAILRARCTIDAGKALHRILRFFVQKGGEK